jgi:hypothetical protein
MSIKKATIFIEFSFLGGVPDSFESAVKLVAAPTAAPDGPLVVIQISQLAPWSGIRIP